MCQQLPDGVNANKQKWQRQEKRDTSLVLSEPLVARRQFVFAVIRRKQTAALFYLFKNRELRFEKVVIEPQSLVPDEAQPNSEDRDGKSENVL